MSKAQQDLLAQPAQMALLASKDPLGPLVQLAYRVQLESKELPDNKELLAFKVPQARLAQLECRGQLVSKVLLVLKEQQARKAQPELAQLEHKAPQVSKVQQE